MRYIPWEEFWWNNITGAHSVIDRVAKALLENKMVVLKVPSDLPWRYPMRSVIQSTFNGKTDSRNIVIETIDAVDNNQDKLEPGKFILQNYASSAIMAGYREKARYSIQDYISDRNVIKNRIIWVKGLDEKSAGKWLRFCGGFSPRSAADGLFVLEMQGKTTSPESRYIEYIDFDNCVSSYDVQQFNSFILDTQKYYSNNWKRYISTVAASVCGTDAEVSEFLLRITDFRNETAIDGLARIEEAGGFSRRGTEKESAHPLWYLRENDTAELTYRVWTAQIQVLFPIIELERQQLIKKWFDAVEAALIGQKVTQFGKTVSDPKEVELGTLYYMLSCRASDDFRMLYIPDETDRDRIHFLHKCRNKLAHMNCCSPKEVAGLLD